jgi:hypothetical protein
MKRLELTEDVMSKKTYLYSTIYSIISRVWKYWGSQSWYIDSVNGNDRNIGTKPGYELKTFEEFQRRVKGNTHRIIVHIVIEASENKPLRVIQIHTKNKFDIN